MSAPAGTLSRSLAGRDTLDWLLLASLVALAFNTHGDLLPLTLFLVLVAVGFKRPALLRLWQFWGAIAAIQGGIQLASWEGIDDHVVVGTYWALALALALWSGRPEASAARSARWIIGLVFLFAAGWKLATPEFRDGSFFTLYLLGDPRFRPLTDLVGGVPPDVYLADREALARLFSFGDQVESVTLVYGDRLVWLARAMSWWGMAIEAALALTWLSPLPGRWQRARHVLLLVFVATTYGVVAIAGFGAILLVMGLAAAPGPRWRRVYGLGLVALVVWTPLWRLIAL